MYVYIYIYLYIYIYIYMRNWESDDMMEIAPMSCKISSAMMVLSRMRLSFSFPLSLSHTLTIYIYKYTYWHIYIYIYIYICMYIWIYIYEYIYIYIYICVYILTYTFIYTDIYLRVRWHDGNGAHVLQNVLGHDGLVADAALGKRHVLGDAVVEVVAHLFPGPRISVDWSDHYLLREDEKDRVWPTTSNVPAFPAKRAAHGLGVATFSRMLLLRWWHTWRVLSLRTTTLQKCEAVPRRARIQGSKTCSVVEMVAQLHSFGARIWWGKCPRPWGRAAVLGR